MAIENSKTLLVFPQATVVKPMADEPVRSLVGKVEGLTKKDKDQFKRVVESWKDAGMGLVADALTRSMERRGNPITIKLADDAASDIEGIAEERQTPEYYAVASASQAKV